MLTKQKPYMSDIISLELSGRKTEVFFANKHEALTIAKTHSLVCDKTIASFLPPILHYLVTLPSGEACKTKEHLFSIIDAIIYQEVERDHTLVGIGGGTVCDVCSFAASIVYRGIPLILIPTTLLGMVDATIGGKTGINYLGYKNMVGSFYPACEVRICPDFLLSLPPEEYKSGLAEIIKIALIGDHELLNILEKQIDAVKARDLALLQAEILPRAIKVKASIVQEDERDQGIRQILNLGHTFGHALESVKKFTRIRHGDAVAWGIRIAVAYAAQSGIIEPNYASHINNILDAYEYEKRYAIDIDEFISAMYMDKKRKDKHITLILPQAKNEIVTATANERFLRKVLQPFIAS